MSLYAKDAVVFFVQLLRTPKHNFRHGCWLTSKLNAGSIAVDFMTLRRWSALRLIVRVVPLAGVLVECDRVGWERGLLAFGIILMIFGCHMLFCFSATNCYANRIQMFGNGGIKSSRIRG